MHRIHLQCHFIISRMESLLSRDGSRLMENAIILDSVILVICIKQKRIRSVRLMTRDIYLMKMEHLHRKAGIDGSFYHFDEYGQMMEDSQIKKGIVIENGICKLYSEDGVLLETGNGEGWSLLGGNYYYLRDGGLLKSGSYKLPDGNWYYFDENGIMQLNVKVKNRWYGES